MKPERVSIEKAVFESETAILTGGLPGKRGVSGGFGGDGTSFTGFAVPVVGSAGAVAMAEHDQPDAGEVDGGDQDETDDEHGGSVYPTAPANVKRDWSGAAFGNPFAKPVGRVEIGADGRPERGRR